MIAASKHTPAVGLLILFLSLLAPVSAVASCEPGHFTVYFVPLELQTYVPLTREDLVRAGHRLELASCEIKELFATIERLEGRPSTAYDRGALRVLVVDKRTKRELFINADKMVLFEGKTFTVSQRLMGEVLTQIKTADSRVQHRSRHRGRR